MVLGDVKSVRLDCSDRMGVSTFPSIKLGSNDNKITRQKDRK